MQRGKEKMGEASWTVSADEYKYSVKAVRMSAIAHGLDADQADLAEFLHNQAKVQANLHAQARWLHNIINKDTSE